MRGKSRHFDYFSFSGRSGQHETPKKSFLTGQKEERQGVFQKNLDRNDTMEIPFACRFSGSGSAGGCE
jgi:hypothetical protein